MKKLYYVILSLLFIQLSSTAQVTNSKIRELGINLSGSTFGFRFKAGKENTVFRFTLLSLNGSSNNYNAPDGSKNNNNTLGFAFNFGVEKRKPVSENLNIYYGSDILTTYQKATRNNNNTSGSTTSTDLTFSPGLGLVMGFNYKISSKINISAEIVPSIIYSSTEHRTNNDGVVTKYSTSDFNYGLRTNGINLTFSFNIGK